MGKSTVCRPCRSDLRLAQVDIRDDELDPSWDRQYVFASDQNKNKDNMNTFWSGRLGGSPGLGYFCPSGWRRFYVKTKTKKTFFGKSTIMYHGTSGPVVSKIIRGGFIPNECQHRCKAIYLSPSITYSAHPRFSRVYQHGGRYYQVVLQVRVPTENLRPFIGETMSVKYKADRIDANLSNDRLEFLYKADSHVKEDIVVTGIMLRCCPEDPFFLDESKWWTCFRSRADLKKGYYQRT